ncbi:DNA repair protein REV1 isoform X2 [Cephus cinctus]|uniref:DNA repair protein REV1 n=1 Tax=Cephus cinctus TaxID=211228 RepID=A0AAJ7C8H1_CEPCN|nr:DNA repair protein REV1 isoform X2 [Cephus cinctus]
MSKRKKNTNWGENGFEDWGGYMAAKKAKLEEQFQIIASTEFHNASTLFQGIAIFVNGYTKPSADELKRLMMAHGGIYHHYMRPRITTHIIASNLPYSKIVMYRKSQHPVPICKPEWISDSLKAGRVLDYQPYLLYTNCTETQPRLMFKAGGTNEKLTISSNNGTKDQNCLKSLSETAKQSIKDIATTLSVIKNNKPLSSEEILSENDPCMLDNCNNEEFTKPNSVTFKSINAARIVSTSVANSSVAPEPTKESAVNQRQVQNVQPKSNHNISTQNVGFLTEFYNNSRLHHISTMGATFKDYINELRDKSDGIFPGLDRLKSTIRKTQTTVSPNGNGSDSDTEIFDVSDNGKKSVGNIVMHIDMDCFFVSVGLRNKPELVGQPVAVAHAKGNRKTRVPTKAVEGEVNDNSEAEREGNMEDDDFGSMSEVASCSYEARKAGVKNGMFLGQALKLCPNLKTIKYDFEGYKEVSYALYDTVASYTLKIEAVSCDEMYADCTSILAETGLNPMQFAKIIRKEIRDKTGCPVSTGFGGNKLQARLATKKAKPDGQFYLEQEMVRSYIGSLNVRDLPGVGMSTTHKLKGMLVQSCAELRNISLASLQKEFGKKTGEMLHNMSRGVDNSKLNLEHVRKSVSAEVNYGIRFKNSIDAEDFLKKLSVEVCARMKKANVRGRSVTLKVMVRAKEAPIETPKFMGHGLCDYYTKSKNFIVAVDDEVIVTREVLALWTQLQQKPEEIRGIGIQISRLESLRSKAGTTNILNFINKIKPCDSENKQRGCDENQLLLHNIEVNSISKKSDSDNGKTENSKNLTTFFSNSVKKDNLDRQRTLEYPGLNNCKIDDSILPALPEDIRNEILHAKHNTVNFEHNKEIQQPGPSKMVTTSKLNMLGKTIQNEESLASKTKKDVCLSSDNNVSNINNFEERPAYNLQNPFMTSDHNNSLFNVLMESETNQETNILQLTQDLDEAVLAELPEDIRNEILAAKIIKKKKNDKKGDKISRPSEALAVDETSSKSSEPGQICISEKKSSGKKIQTSQESYFRHTKPSTSNSIKAKLPPIEQINMAVLVELPEEIRNEILNEYRMKQQEETSLGTKAEVALQTEHNIAIQNIWQLCL